jgi:hypothetical protein
MSNEAEHWTLVKTKKSFEKQKRKSWRITLAMVLNTHQCLLFQISKNFLLQNLGWWKVLWFQSRSIFLLKAGTRAVFFVFRKLSAPSPDFLLAQRKLSHYNLPYPIPFYAYSPFNSPYWQFKVIYQEIHKPWATPITRWTWETFCWGKVNLARCATLKCDT